MFAVQFANFLMFTISGENAIPCLEAFGEKTVSVHRKNILFLPMNITKFSFFFSRKSSAVFGHQR